MSKIITPGHPDFYINRKNYIEVESHACFGVEGYYQGEAIKPGVGVVRSFGMELPTPNLLTNLGMDALGNSQLFRFMHLGTGTGTPDFTDTALNTFGVSIGYDGQTFANAASAPWYVETRLTFISAVGGATGTWTEIGISSQNTNGNLRSRALILDNLGSPTSFPVKADEQFRGTYLFRNYAPASDNVAAITLSGSPYTTTTRALGVSAPGSDFSGNWGAGLQGSGTIFHLSPADSITATGGLVPVTNLFLTGEIGTYGQATDSSTAYTNGNHYLDGSLRWGAGTSVGNVQTVRVSSGAALFQVLYNPIINKLTTQEFIHNQRISWARR